MDLNSLVSGIFVIDVDGPEGLVRLADGTDPAWSPDGSKIAFVANGVGGPGIHLMNADGSNVRRLTSPNNAAQCNEGSSASDWKPDWSPDGRMILFERQIHIDDNWDYDCGLDGYGYVSNVYVMNADGTGVRRLRSVPWTTGDADPAWSPDGRSIAYAVHHSTLFTIDSNGTGPEEAIFWDIAGVPFTPSWSADGRKLLVLCTRPPLAVPPNNFLVIVDLAARSTQVLSFPSVPGLIHDPAWAR